MDGIQVGILGADRSDDADIVLVSAVEDVYRLVRLSRGLGITRNREGNWAFEIYLKRASQLPGLASCNSLRADGHPAE